MKNELLEAAKFLRDVHNRMYSVSFSAPAGTHKDWSRAWKKLDAAIIRAQKGCTHPASKPCAV